MPEQQESLSVQNSPGFLQFLLELKQRKYPSSSEYTHSDSFGQSKDSAIEDVSAMRKRK